jgi:hypothetical protein
MALILQPTKCYLVSQSEIVELAEMHILEKDVRKHPSSCWLYVMLVAAITDDQAKPKTLH